MHEHNIDLYCERFGDFSYVGTVSVFGSGTPSTPNTPPGTRTPTRVHPTPLAPACGRYGICMSHVSNQLGATMANLRQTTSAVFGAITNSANAAANTLNAAVLAADMLNAWVHEAKTEQGKRIAGRMIMLDHEISVDLAEQAMLRESRIKTLIGGDSEKAESFNKHFDEIMAVVSAVKS